MTRKDYNVIAAELKLSRPAVANEQDMSESKRSQRIGFALAVEAVARALSKDNLRFDSERFYSAIYDD